MSIVFLNGEFLPADEAKVSVFDRGFLLGDGVYEVIPAYGGRLFRLSEHLTRLGASLKAIELKNPYNTAEWINILESVVEKNFQNDLSIYLQVTRGVAVRDHAFPANTTPSVFVMSNETKSTNSDAAAGVSAITLDDNRWSRCNIKAISLLPNVLLRQEAVSQGVTEAILLRNNCVTEGAASNVFVVSENTIYTPKKDQYILAGITRDLVVELALENDFNCKKQDVSIHQLLTADEIWLTSSTKEILPIIELDGKEVGTGKPGKVWESMYQIYSNYKKTLY